MRPACLSDCLFQHCFDHQKGSSFPAAKGVQLHTGIAAWTCHQPGSVFDLVPGDLVSSAILAAAAAVTQVLKLHAALLCCALLVNAASAPGGRLPLFPVAPACSQLDFAVLQIQSGFSCP